MPFCQQFSMALCFIVKFLKFNFILITANFNSVQKSHCGTLFIQGEHLHLGLQPSDYRVIIGKTECNATYLGDSELQCQPVKPGSVGDNEPRQSVEVTFTLTHLRHFARILVFGEYDCEQSSQRLLATSYTSLVQSRRAGLVSESLS